MKKTVKILGISGIALQLAEISIIVFWLGSSRSFMFLVIACAFCAAAGSLGLALFKPSRILAGVLLLVCGAVGVSNALIIYYEINILHIEAHLAAVVFSTLSVLSAAMFAVTGMLELYLKPCTSSSCTR